MYQLPEIKQSDCFGGEPTANADDFFVKVGKDKYYSMLDMTKGYYQIKVAEEDIMKTGIVTPDGWSVFQRMPLALSVQQHLQSNDAENVRGFNYPGSYIHDIIIQIEAREEHMDILEELFKIIKSTNLIVWPTECTFGFTKVDFLAPRGTKWNMMTREHSWKDQSSKTTADKKRSQVLGLTRY